MVVLLMFYLERRDSLPTDTILGLLCHGTVATGLVVLAFFPNIRVNLHSLLFGDILGVARADLAVVWVGGALAVLWRLWRPLLAATVDTDLAAVAGMRPERTRQLFGFFVSAVIAVSIKIVGILLIVALLVIPAATVRRFSTSPERMALLATFAGVLSVIAGLYSSAAFDTPSGPSIVVASLILFAVTRVSFAWRPMRS